MELSVCSGVELFKLSRIVPPPTLSYAPAHVCDHQGVSLSLVSPVGGAAINDTLSFWAVTSLNFPYEDPTSSFSCSFLTAAPPDTAVSASEITDIFDCVTGVGLSGREGKIRDSIC
jgi:hypothetical protein